jgi:hypothetical protein
MKTTRVLSLAVMCIVAAAALAHHGWSDYDAKKPLTLTGVIQSSGYENPHGFVKLQVGGSKGKTWTAILAPPSRMERRGLSRDALKAGTTATVAGYPHREKDDEMRAERITIDGKTVELR